eukprot:Em0005g195a
MQILNLSDLLEGSDIKRTSRRTVLLKVESLAQRPPIQKALSAKIDDFQFNQLFNSSSLADGPPLSISSPHASSWLSVVPSEGLGLHLNPDQFQVASSGGLVLDTSGGSLCSLCPDTVLDPLGHHASTCAAAQAGEGCKELQMEVNKLKVEQDQAWSTSEKLEMSNNELRDSSNAFSSQLALALKDKDTLQLQLKAMDKDGLHKVHAKPILEERSTKDAECIQSLESQLFQKKQQLKDLIETQDKRTPSSIHEMAKICDYFDGKSSQDAQEFLGCLLENLHDNIKTEQAEPSIITKLFEGMQQSSVFCAGCENTATRDDPFTFLPIAIPEKQNVCGLELFTSKTLSRYNLFAVINHSGSMYGGCWQKHIESSTEDVHTLIAFIHLLNDMGTGQGASSSYKKDIMCLSSGFERKAQQDSHEFIISLLDKMSKCEQRIAGKKKQQALCNGHQGPEFRGPSLIDVFQGMFLSHTECGKFLKPLNEPRHDLFTSLTVPVPNTQESVPLEDCIQLLMETPFEGVSYKEEKVDTIITFPKIINLSPYMDLSPSEEVPTYELNAVINHYGTIASGHSNEERAAAGLLKRAISTSSKGIIQLGTGGTPVTFMRITNPHNSTTAVCSRTLKSDALPFEGLLVVDSHLCSFRMPLRDEQWRALLKEAGISDETKIGPAEVWLKASNISLACEERVRHASRKAVGVNLKGELASFSFPLPSGGEEFQGAPLGFIPDLILKVVELLEENDCAGRLTWHNGVIPASEMWIKLGGDKGFKMNPQIVNVASPNSVNNTCGVRKTAQQFIIASVNSSLTSLLNRYTLDLELVFYYTEVDQSRVKIAASTAVVTREFPLNEGPFVKELDMALQSIGVHRQQYFGGTFVAP